MNASVFIAPPPRGQVAAGRPRRELAADQVGAETEVARDELGRARVAAPERVEQLLVITHVRSPGIGRVVPEQHPRLGCQGLVRAVEPRAPAELDELLVECEVGRDDPFGRPGLSPGRATQLVHRVLEIVELERFVAALEQTRHDADLDRLPRDVDVEAVGEGEREHERTAVKLGLGESFLDEVPDRLAHGAATRPERAREVDLSEMRPLWDRSFDDRLAQHAVHLLDRRRTLDRRESPIVHGDIMSD